jgi:protein-disulfide isomerase/uncharacterized membrane protein
MKNPVVTGAAALAVLAVVGGAAMSATPGAALAGALIGAALACVAVVAHDPRLGVLVTSLGCAGANAYLLSRKWSAASGPSICSVNATFDCDKINMSDASELMGIPITLIGVAFYVGLALAAWARKRDATELFWVTALFMVPALGYSAWLGWVSKTLGAVCMFCLSIYVGNIVLMAAAVLGLRQDPNARAGFGAALLSNSALTTSGAFAVILLVGSGLWGGRGQPVVAVGSDQGASMPADTLSRLYAEAGGPVDLDGTEPVLGNPDAPYMVVEWADFGCGHCAHAAPEFEALVEANPDIQVRFKAFPLAGPCGAGEEAAESDRCKAAIAAECAHRQGKFWEYAHGVFKNLGYLDDTSLRMHAEQRSLDLAAFDACLLDPASRAGVVSDQEAGRAAGVRGTPAIFLVGVRPDPVFVLEGPGAVEALVDAHKSGRSLPAGGPMPSH